MNKTYLLLLSVCCSLGMLLSGSAIAQTYSNAAGFSVGTVAGPFTPYSSTITVAGGPATVGAMTIDIIGLSHTWPSDIDVMLVGPNGDAMIIMSDAGSGTDVTDVSYSIFDGAATAFNLTQNLSGSYRPYNNGGADGMPAPAPAVYGDAAPAGAATLFSTFGGDVADGDWTLFLQDDAGGDAGTITGGWSITFSSVVPGCTDPIACNFDAAATTNDGSCEYLSCQGCTDAAACNFDATATINVGCDYTCIGCTTVGACNYEVDNTIDDGSCCFDNCITLNVTGGIFPGEVSWTLTDAVSGALLANGVPGTFTLCLTDACFNFNMFDSFGDGWNGAVYTFSQGATVLLTGTLDTATSGDGVSFGTELLVVNGGCTPGCTDPLSCNFDAAADLDFGCDFTSCAGCTDPLATNYDAAATIDDGSCIFCAGGEILMIVDMVDSFGDGWNGAAYTMTTVGGVLIASGDIDTATIGDGFSVGTDAFCMAPGCYVFTVTGGAFPGEVSWSLTDQLGNNYGAGGAPASLNVDFGFTGTCGFSGCTDSNCIGYNPSATIDDGSCLCPPANNDVCNAEAVTCGLSVAGTLANATDNEGLIGSTCSGIDVDTPGVWYSYNAAADEQVFLSLCNSTGVTDTKIHVYLAAPDCNSLVCVAANDDGCGAGSFLSEMAFNASTGSDYYILVSEFGFASGGDFTLDVTCVSCGAFPSNDDCADAQPVVSGLTITESLCCAGPSGAPNFAAGFATAYDVWYSFNSSDFDTFFFDVTNVSGGNVGLMFYTGDCSAPVDFVGCLVTGQCAGDIGDFLTLTPNTDYFFSIFTTEPLACGDYTLDVLGVYFGCTDPVANNYDAGANTDDGTCDYAGVVNPLNECANAATVVCGDNISGSTGGATAIGSPFGLTCDAAPGSGVWYTYTGTGDLVTISTCGSVIDSKINVWAGDCVGGFACVDAVPAGFASETADFGSCGFFDQDDAEVSFISVLGTSYYIYVGAEDADANPITDDNGLFNMSIACEVVVEGCTNPAAYNYNAAANVEDGTCDYFSDTCGGGPGTPLKLDMVDSFGDGWNGNVYTITDGLGGVVATGDLDGALYTVDEDNFLGADNGFDLICLQDGCYNIIIDGGLFIGETSFSLVDELGNVVAAGGGGVSVSFSIGSAICGCTDPGACNFDAAATDDDGSCEYVTCAGCTDPAACNFDATATIDDLSCCFDNCVTFVMNDSFGDGWNGAVYEIFTIDGTFVASGDLDNAQSGDGFSTGTDILCLADGCYTLNVTAGTFPLEVSWTLFGSNSGVVSGGANANVNFSVGSGACVVGCTEPVACNYDPAANIADCEACTYDTCIGCTYPSATNYDPAASIDDQSCTFDLANPCPEDLNGDGIINAGDLLQFLGAFGTSCI